jgi:hypothetical protein
MACSRANFTFTSSHVFTNVIKKIPGAMYFCTRNTDLMMFIFWCTFFHFLILLIHIFLKSWIYDSQGYMTVHPRDSCEVIKQFRVKTGKVRANLQRGTARIPLQAQRPPQGACTQSRY